MICKICNTDIKETSNAFSWHLKLKHKLSVKQYYDLYYKKDKEGLCAVCGKETKFHSILKGYRTHCSYKCSNNDADLLDKKITKFSYTLKNKSEKDKNNTRYKQILSNVIKHFNCDLETAKNYIENNKIVNIGQLDWIKEKCNTEVVKRKISKTMSDYQKTITTEQRNKMTQKFYDTCFTKYGKCQFNQNYLYNDIKFHSSWELAYYIWLKDNNINFEYQLKPIPYNVGKYVKHYTPDFKVNGLIVEIKNSYLLKQLKYGSENNKAKYKCMLDNNVYIMSNSEIYPILNYVKNKYGKNYLNIFKHKFSKADAAS